MVVGTLSACNQGTGSTTNGTSTPAVTSSQSSDPEGTKPEGTETQSSEELVTPSYPLTTENKTLTVYMKDSTSGVVGDFANIEAFQVATEKLGVTIDFIHPAVGSESDQFNLMIASKQYPDVIFWDYSSTPMGLEQLIDEGVLINMDEYIKKYAPNYLAVLENRDDFRKEATANDGTLSAMYSFSARAPISGGPTLRGDMLKQYDLELPTTVDEWTEVMTTLKEKDPAVQYPLTTGQNRDGSVWFDLLLPAYKTSNGFCLDGETGSIVYGPTTENYKNYVSKLNEWYVAGLIDPEFMSNDGRAMNAKLADGTCVAGSLQLNYHIANITNNARQDNPSFEFEGAKWPVLNEGDTVNFNINGGLYFSGNQAGITRACEDPVLATQVMDYFYSEEGNNLLCWGIEGKSYTVNADGSKTYTDEIMKNPEGKTPQEAILKYSIPTFNFTNIILPDSYTPMVTTLPEQAVARDRWLDAEPGVNIPKLTVASDKQSDYNMIMNEVITYLQEMYIRFISGQSSLETDWETYINVLNGMGIESAVEMQREAFELYKVR